MVIYTYKAHLNHKYFNSLFLIFPGAKKEEKYKEKENTSVACVIHNRNYLRNKENTEVNPDKYRSNFYLILEKIDVLNKVFSAIFV